MVWKPVWNVDLEQFHVKSMWSFGNVDTSKPISLFTHVIAHIKLMCISDIIIITMYNIVKLYWWCCSYTHGSLEFSFWLINYDIPKYFITFETNNTSSSEYFQSHSRLCIITCNILKQTLILTQGWPNLILEGQCPA